MSQVKRVLKHLAIEVAKSMRTCHRNSDHAIPKGTASLAIYEEPRSTRRNYCAACAANILSRAGSDLASLRQRLDANEASD